MIKRLYILKKYLEEKNLNSYSKRVDDLLKFAADLVLNQKTYAIMYSAIKKHSEEYKFLDEEEKRNFFEGDNKEKIDGIISEIHSIIFEEIIPGEKHFLIFENRRGDQIACIKWCLVQSYEEYGFDASKEDLTNLVSLFATMLANQNKIFYNHEKDSIEVLSSFNDQNKSDLVKSLKRDGYKPISSSSEFKEEGIYYRGPLSYSRLFRESFIYDYSKDRKDNIENKMALREGSEEIYNDGNYTVTFLKTHEACNLGYFESTEWCITASDPTHWNMYSGRDNLHFYVIENISEKNKSEPMRKMAIPFQYEEIYLEELRDKDDNGISLEQIKDYLGEKYEPIFNAMLNHRKETEVLTKEFAENMGVERDAFRAMDSSAAENMSLNLRERLFRKDPTVNYQQKELYFKYILHNYNSFDEETFIKFVAPTLIDGFFIDDLVSEQFFEIVGDETILKIIKAYNFAANNFGPENLSKYLTRYISSEVEIFNSIKSKTGEDIQLLSAQEIERIKNSLVSIGLQMGGENNLSYQITGSLRSVFGSPMESLKMSLFLNNISHRNSLKEELLSSLDEDSVANFFEDLKEFVFLIQGSEAAKSAERSLEAAIRDLRGY